MNGGRCAPEKNAYEHRARRCFQVRVGDGDITALFAQIPAAWSGRPEEIAGTVMFLVSDEEAFAKGS